MEKLLFRIKNEVDKLSIKDCKTSQEKKTKIMNKCISIAFGSWYKVNKTKDTVTILKEDKSVIAILVINSVRNRSIEVFGDVEALHKFVVYYGIKPNKMKQAIKGIDENIMVIYKGNTREVTPYKKWFYNEKEIHCVDTGEIAIGYNKYLKTEHWHKLYKYKTGTCSRCKKIKETVLHHKTYDNLGNETQSDFIEVCNICHKTIHRQLNKQYDNKQGTT